MRSLFPFLVILLVLSACQESGNRLARSNNPYLLQHAQNPVDWFPWEEDAFEKAQAENKLIILSIGYAACHWCHVMEEECFEDEEVAEYMNAHFISIKVDREERPDIDEIYQRASELTTGKGGWPLNVICLPDGKPFYSTTYLDKEGWLNLLSKIQEHYLEKPDELITAATKITEGVQQSQLIFEEKGESAFSPEKLDSVFSLWKEDWDWRNGGFKGSPKFPLPNNLKTILDYGILAKDSSSLNFVQLSLKAMAAGGLYDQIGDGFARYSTDSAWRIPHFEKMLYDNAQLISLYAQASRAFKNPEYLEKAKLVMQFAEKEWQGKDKAFSSSTDADVAGEEGKYYSWTLAELQEHIAKEDWPLFSEYYGLEDIAKWEKDLYILQTKPSAFLQIQEKFEISSKALGLKVTEWKSILAEKRNSRTKPSIDDKKLSSWNALMLGAYLELYRASGSAEYLDKAKALASWFESQEPLLHSQRLQKAGSQAFLQDYAFASSAFIDLFLLSANPDYLKQAESWMQEINQQFKVKDSPLFYTQSKNSSTLVANGVETADQVLPSANAVIAHNFLRLALLLENQDYRKQAWSMLRQMQSRIENYPDLHAHWLNLALKESFSFYEVAVTGPKAQEMALELEANYLPQALIAWAKESPLSLFENRIHPDSEWIYVCQFGTCKQPVQNVEAALKQLELP
ncbi:thioredoxin domain-containing protein [Croceimicrobium hydrocarbonivorans]|uniref:Thioredoxin domain-containing protein n=1 Tax=Croceimicrobium hydrocarbonivorans TaxID=2761580 RepID=A0A7H0VIG0_9FLAO|nr:thioredoxin domain-containing protein [Croceimicrobium hydrocarbonivorans]QNR25508.1 thioredoxin domain-containing protein [Croceimicrobium hydrocarbonivorans]